MKLYSVTITAVYVYEVYAKSEEDAVFLTQEIPLDEANYLDYEVEEMEDDLRDLINSQEALYDAGKDN